MSDSHEQSRWRRPLAALGVFVLFAGMLFWTKLRLVSDIPRSAYAVPKEVSQDETPKADRNAERSGAADTDSDDTESDDAEAESETDGTGIDDPGSRRVD